MNRHFAALGDVWKHLVLAEIFRRNPPTHYWETHAGAASYPLTESVTRRHGALRFISRARREAILHDSGYLAALQSMPGTYPGSAIIAMRSLGSRARYLLCETDPHSADSLRQAAGTLDSEVLERDGMTTIAEAVETTGVVPGDVLVHIDPFDPYAKASAASPSAIELAGALAQKGFRVAYWYGYEAKEDRGWPCNAVRLIAPRAPLWCGDIALPSPFVFPERAGLWGCGVLLANPGTEVTMLSELGSALERISDDDLLPGNDPERLTFREVSTSQIP